MVRELPTFPTDKLSSVQNLRWLMISGGIILPFTGWWFGTFFFHILGISSSQLTNIFQRGWNHQPDFIYFIYWYSVFFNPMGKPLWTSQWNDSGILNAPPWGWNLRNYQMTGGNKHPLISYDLGYHPGASVFTAKSWYKMREKQRI